MTVSHIEGLAAWELEAVAEINRLEVEADTSEAESSDKRWKQAERVVKALESGMTQQQIAQHWKRPDGSSYSQSHVAFVKKTHEHYYLSNNRPRWNEAYNSDEVRGGKTAHVSHNAGENEWYTPAEYIQAAVAVMGAIDLDPASTIAANQVVGAACFYSEADNGLAYPWHGRIWMNPPYAQPLIGEFCLKLAGEFYEDRTTQACALVNNATETAWFQGLVEFASAVCFPKGRVKFWHPDRESAPLQGQSVVYLGENVEGFRTEFTPFGFTALL